MFNKTVLKTNSALQYMAINSKCLLLHHVCNEWRQLNPRSRATLQTLSGTRLAKCRCGNCATIETNVGKANPFSPTLPQTPHPPDPVVGGARTRQGEKSAAGNSEQTQQPARSQASGATAPAPTPPQKKEPRDLDNNHPSLMKTGARSRTRDNVQKQRPLLLLQTQKPFNLDSNQSLGVKTNVKS
jgi:hypothetical protein